jgi:hypothetical protein
VNSWEWINSLSTVHVACEQWRVLHCSLGQTSLAQPKMSGPSPARSKQNSKNIYIFENLWFFCVFFY